MKTNLLLIALFISLGISAQISDLVVTIDPGHGGSQPGALGYNGASFPDEADLVLDISLMLENELISRGFNSSNVRLTRSSDVTLGINERRNWINAQNPDASLSIHLNSVSDASANGTETLYFHNTILASKVQTYLVNALGFSDRGIKYRNNLGVLQTNSSIPAALSESLFISNLNEWNFVNTSSGKTSIVNAHADALFDFFNLNTSATPDLVIENMWTVPANPAAGENVDLYVEIKNVGNQTANLISLDYKIGNTTIGSDSHSSLAPNETQTEFYDNYVFNTSGSYNYCVFIDALASEQNTANSSFCIDVNVNNSGGSEDIFLTNVSVSPTTVNAGSDVTGYATMNYSGNQLDADLDNFNLNYYLSTDCNLSNDDIYLEDDISGLGSDDPTNDENENLTIPSNTPSGTYYILFVADADDELNESNENNNIECIQITVNGNSGGSEDIFLTNVSVSPTTVNAGSDVTGYATMNYSGNQLDADLDNFNLNYYLSTDCNLSNDDIYLEDDISGLGSDDPTNDENENLTIPSNTPSGTYYILFVADADDELNESNENNNIECIQITVESALSIGDYEFQNQLTIYPNPSSDLINISSNTNLEINKIYIYDLNGRIVKIKEGNNLNKLNISELTNGIYLLKIVNNENKKAVFRIVKE